MGAQKKGAAAAAAAKAADDSDDLARVPLQAVLLADSFTTKFRPITLERPKVLLPLVNVPMIDYTLAWLESAGVEEVFVVCCAHSEQVTEYLESSQWLDQPNFVIKTIKSDDSRSAGDALRSIYGHGVIHGDFVLVSGDTVSNMSLTQALLEHKERKKKDNNVVMTMIIKQSKPSPVTHQSRLGTDELFMAIDPSTKLLLYYEDKADPLKGSLTLDKAFLADNSSITLHNDMQDCYIDICSPEVLSLFTDNFDYQHLRRHFVKGLLVDDIMGYKIFTHQIHSSYAARIDNFRSYDTVSKDIIHRWTYPLVPDVKFFGNSTIKLERQGVYRATEIGLSRSAHIGPFTFVGSGSKIGDKTKISNSVIGEGCNIGSNVIIEGSYVWNNVTIEDGCNIRHAIVCSGVVIKSGAVLEPGVVLSFKVIVGQNFVVPAYSKVSLHEQPIEEDSDEGLEYADNSLGTVDSSSNSVGGEMSSELSEAQLSATSELGSGGLGHIWSICEDSLEEEWRHSVAPIPADKVVEIAKAIDDELDLAQDGVLPSEELEHDSEEDDDEFGDDTFEKEVEATFLRAVCENINIDHVISEVNPLRFTYNKDAADSAGAFFYAMMKWALDTPHSSASELFRNVANVITTWQKLLKFCLPGIDEEIEVILKFEEMCLESAKEYAPLFAQILHLLYDKDIIQEEAILRWESEKVLADESDRIFVKQSEQLLQWLKEASEEED